jgi:hypothetical protein
MMVEQGRFDESGNTGITQQTIAEAAIKVCFHFYSLFAQSIAPRVDGQQMLPFAAPGSGH